MVYAAYTPLVVAFATRVYTGPYFVQRKVMTCFLVAFLRQTFLPTNTLPNSSAGKQTLHEVSHQSRTQSTAC
jgi:hypothetical protein